MRDKIGNKKKRMNTRLKNILMITILIASFILLINSAYAETLIIQNSNNAIQYDIKFIKSENDNKFYSNNNFIKFKS